MKTLLITLLMSVFTLSGSYAIDLSAYELMDKFEKRGYDEKKLHKFASYPDRHNKKEEKQEYIPPYEDEDLSVLKKWAMGDAFFAYSKIAGVKFNGEAYHADCPNWAMFSFLKATGTEHIKFDVMLSHVNISFAMNYAFQNKDLETFKEVYLKYAEDNGFMKYITIL